ncbi:sarcosine oxidase subunit gamma [Ensifer sp. BR816]|uniref:sarcosine oxidase subunit gamma n=1 Tax=Rhizobium sp. (strain BR816) TaxID=1057002 RepID=UPI00035F2696|nr:hypothetical protein [Ensifer sp. BR816]
MNIAENNPLSSLPTLLLSGVFELMPVATEARFNLRARHSSVAEISRTIGINLPARMGDVVATQGKRAICVGPDEWLLSCEFENSSDLMTAVGELSRSTALSLVEITDRDCGLRVVGPKAAYALKAACPYDVEAMPQNTATRTLFDQADVLVVREGENSYRLQMLRSWSTHVGTLMAIIGREIAADL